MNYDNQSMEIYEKQFIIFSGLNQYSRAMTTIMILSKRVGSFNILVDSFNILTHNFDDLVWPTMLLIRLISNLNLNLNHTNIANHNNTQHSRQSINIRLDNMLFRQNIEKMKRILAIMCSKYWPQKKTTTLYDAGHMAMW